MVGVDHQPGLRANAVAHRLDQGQVLAPAAPDLHLDRGEAALHQAGAFLSETLGQVRHPLQHHAVAVDRDAPAEGAAKQLVERPAVDLAGDVPERDVERRERLDRHALLAVIAQQVVDLVPDHLAGHRVHAEHQGLDGPFDDRLVAERDRSGTETLAIAGHPLVGRHLDDVGRCAG